MPADRGSTQVACRSQHGAGAGDALDRRFGFFA